MKQISLLCVIGLVGCASVPEEKVQPYEVGRIYQPNCLAFCQSNITNSLGMTDAKNTGAGSVTTSQANTQTVSQSQTGSLQDSPAKTITKSGGGDGEKPKP